MQEFSVQSVISLLSRRWPVMLAIMVVGIGTALFGLSLLPERYTGRVTILIAPTEGDLFRTESALSPLGRDVAEIATQVEVIRSRALVETVIQELDLNESLVAEEELALVGSLRCTIQRARIRSACQDSASESPESLTQVASNGEAVSAGSNGSDALSLEGEEAEVARTEALTDAFFANLKVEQIGRSRAISVEFTHAVPATSAAVANALGEAYLRAQVDTKFETISIAADWLSQRLAELRIRMEESEAEVVAYRSDNNLVETARSTLLEDELSQLNIRRAEARARLAETNARLELVEEIAVSGDAAALSEVVNSPLIQQQKIRETELEQALAEMDSELGPRHPSTQAAQAELVNLRERIRGEVGVILTSIRSEAAAATAALAALEDETRQRRTAVTEQAGTAIRLETLEREAAANRALYESFLQEFKRNNERGGLTDADAQILSYATVPKDPSFPPKRLFLAMAAIVSLAMAAGLVALLEHGSNSFLTSADVNQELGQPVAGVIPHIAKKRRLAPENHVLERPNSEFSESVRGLATTIQSQARQGSGSVFLVTSAVANEGKTLFASSLARLMAKRDAKVVLLDLDVRRPAIHRAMGMHNSTGVTDVVTGRCSLQEALKRDDKSGLMLLTAGMYVEDSVSVFQSPEMDSLLEMLRHDFDVVILDGPPILPVADARVCAPRADHSVLMVRWRMTPRAVSKQAFQLLSEASGGQEPSIVLSRVNTRLIRKYGDQVVGYRLNRQYYIN